MKTVIQWTTYDGTDETLPKAGHKVLLIRIDEDIKAVEESCLVPTRDVVRAGDDVVFVNKWQHHPDRPRLLPQIGDMWSYWPQLPENMGVQKPLGMCDALYAHRLEKVVKAAKAFYNERDWGEDNSTEPGSVYYDLMVALDNIKDMMK